MDLKESVEIGIRSALIAKSTLNLTEINGSTMLARMHFVEIVKQLKELDQFINRLEQKEGIKK